MTKQAAILALATAVPVQAYRQQELYDLMAPFFGTNRRLRAIFEHAGIDCRHVVVDGDFYGEERTTAARNARYVAEAVPLGEQTIRRCLEQAGLGPESVDDFVVVSCTGIDTPGLDLRLAGKLGMRPDLQRASVLGMGCYAAMPGLLRARQAALQSPGRRALLLAIELCSLHFQPQDRSVENVVASALFADGAAAVLLGGEPGDAAAPRFIDAATYCDYSTFEHMAFQLTDHGFRMRLSAYVPELLGAEVEGFVDGLLARNGLSRAAVSHWAIHPGGSKILDHVQARLGLGDDKLEPSRAVLRDYGNMSSPTVLFVLERLLCQARPAPGEYGVMLAFGPGLTMEGALLQW